MHVELYTYAPERGETAFALESGSSWSVAVPRLLANSADVEYGFECTLDDLTSTICIRFRIRPYAKARSLAEIVIISGVTSGRQQFIVDEVRRAFYAQSRWTVSAYIDDTKLFTPNRTPTEVRANRLGGAYDFTAASPWLRHVAREFFVTGAQLEAALAIPNARELMNIKEVQSGAWVTARVPVHELALALCDLL